VGSSGPAAPGAMARKRQKKGEKGNAKNYITRTKALRRLQLSLKDFRQICIFKGIYPREPRKKVEGQSKTYYLMKDIQFLQHESVIDKMRELKVFRRKLKRAQRKGMERSAQNLQAAKPRYTLDHIVRERFPTFIDCVNDMDDALCVLHWPRSQLRQPARTSHGQPLALAPSPPPPRCP
jgi:pescadillo protein